MDNIKNKTALITGGASGLGLSYAKALLQNGAKAVAMLDLSSSPGPASVTALEKEFGKGKALFLPCDVTNYEEFAEAFKKAYNALNGLDIVINNAGIFNDIQWEQTLKVNVGGVIKGSLLAMEYMGKHKGGKGGTLVNIASIVALNVFSMCPVYSSTKHDVLAFSRALQQNIEATGVRVLVMCPGVTSTQLLVDLETKVFDFIDPVLVKKLFGTLPSQPPEVVANAMANLIQHGKNGSVWVTEGSQPPYAVEFPPFKKVELNL